MMDETLNCRSILCTPITKEMTFETSSLSCDAIVLDLEDSIPLAEKEKARNLLDLRLQQARQIPSRPKVIVRINSVNGKNGIQDLVALVAAKAAPDAIHIPKAENREEVQFVHHFLRHYCPSIRLQLIIETAKGLNGLSALVKDAPYINGLVFGAADFAADIRSNLNWDSLKIYRLELIKIAKLNNLHVIDAPYFDFRDLEALKGEVAKSYDLGFSGKIAIHPIQVEPINGGFLPNLNDFLESLEIVDESKKHESSIFTYKGRMIGPPIVNCARRVIGTYRQFQGAEHHA